MAVQPAWKPIQSSAPDKNYWEWATGEQLGQKAGGANFWNTLTPGQDVSGSPGFEWAQNNGVWGTQQRGTPSANTTLGVTPTAAPAFTAPTLGVVDPYQGPAPFQYGAFEAPGAEGMYADPGYQYRLGQGVKALDASAAARGTLRGGAQQQALLKLGQDYGSDEYSKVFSRGLDTYRTNRDTATGVFDRGERTAVDAYDRNRLERDASFDARFRGTEAEYKPGYDTWTANELARRRDAEANWNRDYDLDIYNRDDLYKRWRDQADHDFRNRTFASDDEFRRWRAEQDDRRFLVTAGNY